MAKVQSTVPGERVLNALSDGPDGQRAYSIPPCVTSEGVVTNGVGEIPDALLDELLAKDAWTKAVFASGELVDMRKGQSAQPESPPADDGGKKAKADKK